MIQDFYFRFFKLFHNERFCCFLSRIAYLLYCLLYILKKLFLRKCNINMNLEHAQQLINETYPRPCSMPEYINPPINQAIDLSVVIPVYNYADVLEKNVQSILNQNTKYNYNVIFVDDGSTDGAINILEKYKSNKRVTVIKQKNGGIGAARNTGINHATGKYLMFIDCDDTVHEDIIEKLMDKAYRNESDIAICAHNLVKEKNGKTISVLPNLYPTSNLIGYKNGDKIMNFPGLPWEKVYKRNLWNKVRFFPGYWYEDTIIHSLIFMQCQSYSYIPEALYDYKWYENNFSHTQGKNKSDKVIDRYWLLIEILEQYQVLGLEFNNQFYTMLLKHLSVHYYPSIRFLDEEKIEALYVLARDIFLRYQPKNKVKLPYMLRQVEKSFQNNDMNLWKLASCSI